MPAKRWRAYKGRHKLDAIAQSSCTMCAIMSTPNLPTNIVPTNIAWLKLSGASPMGLGISPLKFKIVLESNPLKSKLLIGGLGVAQSSCTTCAIISITHLIVHPVRNPRFASSRTQPFENLSAAVKLPINKKVSGQPNPWNKSWIVTSCYVNWVYFNLQGRPRRRPAPPKSGGPAM